jgi:hypothetical protein
MPLFPGMKRPKFIGLILLGACTLVLLGFLIRHQVTNKSPDGALRHAATDHSAMASRRTKAEETKINLGDVAAVPFQELYGLLARRTPEEIAALARQLQSLPRNPKSEAKIAAFFKAWATLDATAAFAAATSFQPELRSAAIGAVLDGADASVAGTLATSINELPEGIRPPSMKTNLLARAVGKWSQADPVAAAKFLDSSDEHGINFSMAWNEVASNWAAIDPVAALAWARQDAKEGERFAMSGAITGWWKNDPSAAEAYVTSHLATKEDWELASTLASDMFNEDPERAKKWVSQLPNDDARKQATLRLAIQLGFSDPAIAAKWSATLPDEERTVALAESVGMWAQQDPAAAGQWLASYDGPGRDVAVQGFTLNVASKDPATALSWAATISDPELRASSEQRIAGDWLKQNPQAAAAWIQNSSLPPEEKTRLLISGPGR